jgi:hypothetical protein
MLVHSMIITMAQNPSFDVLIEYCLPCFPFDFVHSECSNAYNFAISRDLSYMLGEESISTRPLKDPFSMRGEYVHYSFSFYRIAINEVNTFSFSSFGGDLVFATCKRPL